MGFLRRLFGGGDDKEHRDPQGLYFYVQCDNCGAKVRLRADKKYDLNRTEQGYTWHKTIVDSKCFRQIPTLVHLDGDYNVVSAEIEGGQYITKEEYEAPPQPLPEEAEEAEAADGPEAPGEPVQRGDDGDSE